MVVREANGLVTTQIQYQGAFGLIKTSGHSFKLDDPNIIATVKFKVQDDRTTSLAVTQNGATSKWTRR